MRILLFLAGLALAQAPAPTEPATPGAATPGSPSTPTPGAPGQAAPADDAAVRRALELPFAARALRSAGVPEADVRSSLGSMRDAGVSAGDATEVTDGAAKDAAEHGPVDNFGAFVQEQLAAGRRGQDLAQAIKAEHAARGKGKPDHAGGKPGEAGAHGKPEHAGQEGHGKAGTEDHGKSGNGPGKPDGKPGAGGKPDGAGKPDAAGGRGKKEGEK